MTTVEIQGAKLQSPFVVTAKKWEESTNQDFAVICTDASGREFRGFVTLHGNTAFEGADLYVEPYGPVAKEDWKFGDEWKGTLLGRSFGL